MRSYLALMTFAALVAAACDDEPSAPPAALSMQKAAPSGDNQIDTVLATLASPFRVLVSRGNAPAPGVAVSWRAFPDTSSSISTTTTDASGIAEFRRTLGRSAGAYQSQASVPGAVGSPVVFTATANPGKPTLRYVSGNNQADTANARLGADYTVQTTDSHDNWVAGVAIDWAVTAGGGSITPTRSTTQAGSGYASARHTLGPSDGAQTATATASTLPGAPQQAFTATAYRLGSLELTAATTGVDLDPNGYSITADGAIRDTTVAVAANQTLTMRLRPDDYRVTLSSVAVNCDTTSPRSRTVTLPSGGSAAVAFDVACATVTQLAFATNLAGNPAIPEIYIINSNGTGLTQLTTNTVADVEPAWSRDGSKLAFRSERDEDIDGNRNAEIYVMNADGSNQMRLTNHPATDYQPTWSPDGTKIAFVSSRDGNLEIYVMNVADGTNLVRLTNDPGFDVDPAWSTDGTKIAFVSSRDGSTNLYVMNAADGTNVVRLTSGRDGAPAWSPDGSQIAFSRVASCDYYYCEGDIYVMNANGMGATQLTSGPDDHGDPTWSPDGRWIAFASSPCDYYYGYCYGYFAYIIKAVRENGIDLTEVTSGYGVQPAWRP